MEGENDGKEPARGKPGIRRWLSDWVLAGASPPSPETPATPSRDGSPTTQEEDDSGEHHAERAIRSPTWPLLAGAVLVLGVGAVKPLLPAFEEHSTQAYWGEVVPLFLAEIGVALMVAFFIGLTIDSQVKSREHRERAREMRREREIAHARQAEAVEREQRMVQDVFRGVLGIRHSSAYVRKVVETNLEQRIVRETVTLIYTLRHLTPAEAEAIGDGRFLMLDQTVSFAFENLSSEDQDVPLRFVVPVRHGQRLRDVSRITSAVIGNKEVDIVESAEGASDDAKVYVWTRRIPAHQKLSVVVSALVVKEESDTEVFCSYYPCTKGMSLQVSAPPELNLGIRNNTASRHVVAKNPGHTGTGLWKIDGPILPNDSVVFYWRTDRDEGESAAKPREGGSGRLAVDGLEVIAVPLREAEPSAAPPINLPESQERA